jgi:hypothetical protein
MTSEKRVSKHDDGLYHIHGKTFKEYCTNSRRKVFNGTAYMTTGGLTKKQLMRNKHGNIVSVKKHRTAKREKRLQKYGYFAKKGEFGFVKRESTRKMRK